MPSIHRDVILRAITCNQIQRSLHSGRLIIWQQAIPLAEAKIFLPVHNVSRSCEVCRHRCNQAERQELAHAERLFSRFSDAQ